MKTLSLSLLFLTTSYFSQNIGINSTGLNPHPSAILDVDASPSNNKGALMPRLTTAQRIAIVSPASGLLVYDTSLKGIYIYDGTSWDCLNNPAGTIQYFANNLAPRGYLECNGQSVSTTQYPELFTAIGYTYGGSGAIFKVPDLRGEFIRNWDNGKGIDNARTIGSKQNGTLIVGDIDGTSTTNAVTLITINPASGFNTVGADPVIPTDYTPGTVGFTNLGAASSIFFDTRPDVFGVTRPRNIALMACIKY